MLTEKEKKTKEYMEKQLSVPTGKFLLKYGILFWGVPFVILITLFEYFFSGKSFQKQWNEDILFRVLIMIPAGALYGYLLRRNLKNNWTNSGQKKPGGKCNEMYDGRCTMYASHNIKHCKKNDASFS